MMKKMFGVLVAVLMASGAEGQVTSEQVPSRWQDSYEQYRTTIRHSDAPLKFECELLLGDILKTIDENNTCQTDDQCVLIGEDPFGSTVPVRPEIAKTLAERMHDYKKTCDNDTFHSVTDPQVLHEPVCWKTKCMVRTSRKTPQ